MSQFIQKPAPNIVGDMLISVYDPAGGAKQVAFEADVDLVLDFLSLEPYVFTAPYDMVFNTQVSQGTDATLSVPLATPLDQYDPLVITPTSLGVVQLIGVKL